MSWGFLHILLAVEEHVPVGARDPAWCSCRRRSSPPATPVTANSLSPPPLRATARLTRRSTRTPPELPRHVFCVTVLDSIREKWQLQLISFVTVRLFLLR